MTLKAAFDVVFYSDDATEGDGYEAELFRDTDGDGFVLLVRDDGGTQLARVILPRAELLAALAAVAPQAVGA